MLNKWLIIRDDDGHMAAGRMRETFFDRLIMVADLSWAGHVRPYNSPR
jgi:hypothetical protein